MKKDQIKGQIKKTKGTAKEVIGKLIGNKELEAEGKIEKAVGSAQATYGDFKNEVEKDS